MKRLPITIVIPHLSRREEFFHAWLMPAVEAVLRKGEAYDVLIMNDDQEHPNAKRNRGARKAKTDYVFFLDDDTILGLGSLRRLYEAIREGIFSFAYGDSLGVTLPGIRHFFAGTYLLRQDWWSQKQVDRGTITPMSLFLRDAFLRPRRRFPRGGDRKTRPADLPPGAGAAARRACPGRPRGGLLPHRRRWRAGGGGAAGAPRCRERARRQARTPHPRPGGASLPQRLQPW